MYTNLLLFLIAIFLFSVDSVPEAPLFAPSVAASLMLLLPALYNLIAVRLFNRDPGSSADYFKTEKLLSILAIFFFAATLYFCDPKYYLSKLPLTATFPSLVSFSGLLLFLSYWVLMWRAGRGRYEQVFGRKHTAVSFVVSNIKANLPIVLPWIVLSLFYDLTALVPSPGIQSFLGSQWGDLLFFAAFLVFVLLFFPPLVKRLWNCKQLPEGALKEHLESFSSGLGFKGDFYLWPLFEGRVLTAAVMGIIPGRRYILLTPALIETMNLKELEAILAHEIGHVKMRHLLLYIFLIGGFSLFTGVLAEPVIHLLLSLGFTHDLMLKSGFLAEDVVTLVGAIPLLLFLIVYFRFIFGYFIRNFERQADLYSLQSVGSSQPLVSAFEKISLMSGNIRNQKNWHHFGIGERIDCLEQAERDPAIIGRQNRKVRSSLLAYVVIVVLAVTGVRLVPTEALAERYQQRFAEAALMQRAAREPDQALWQRLIGDLMISKKMEDRALAAYEKAFSLDPTNPEVMNNFAWLLLTSENLSLRDPGKALTLARGAAILQPRGYVLDTLATAYWANGFLEEAVRLEKQAIAEDPANARYYQSKILKFLDQTYEESLVELRQVELTGEKG
jgi:Zn-dependent protease with chaperone function